MNAKALNLATGTTNEDTATIEGQISKLREEFDAVIAKLDAQQKAIAAIEKDVRRVAKKASWV